MINGVGRRRKCILHPAHFDIHVDLDQRRLVGRLRDDATVFSLSTRAEIRQRENHLVVREVAFGSDI